jgi:hypothetical protein
MTKTHLPMAYYSLKNQHREQGNNNEGCKGEKSNSR